MPIRKTHSLVLITALASTLSTTAAFAHWEGSRPDAHAPIGVMPDHTHKAGEWMFSYRAMHMEMVGNRNEKNRLSTSQVHDQFAIAPEKMEMHMLGAMYAPNDNVTLNIMVPYVKNSMDHITRMTATLETIGEGLGDISVGGIFNLTSIHVDGETPTQH